MKRFLKNVTVNDVHFLMNCVTYFWLIIGLIGTILNVRWLAIIALLFGAANASCELGMYARDIVWRIMVKASEEEEEYLADEE